jgi:hypothetical protein
VVDEGRREQAFLEIKQVTNCIFDLEIRKETYVLEEVSSYKSSECLHNPPPIIRIPHNINVAS